MTRILFICHGNICRSPMAEYYMKDAVKKLGIADRYAISSAATSTEELGNGVYPPARRILGRNGIDCSAHRARQIRPSDYGENDLIIIMDERNRRGCTRFFGNDPEGKIHLLMDYTDRPGTGVADPWYTDDFESAWRDIRDGCDGIIRAMNEKTAP